MTSNFKHYFYHCIQGRLEMSMQDQFQHSFYFVPAKIWEGPHAPQVPTNLNFCALDCCSFSSWLPRKTTTSREPLITSVRFSSCQWNLTKTFQIEGMIALITKLTLIFSSDLLNGQKQLSKKAKIFRNFRNKSCSILMLHKINKNKKCAPKLIFFNKFFFQKDSDDF